MCVDVWKDYVRVRACADVVCACGVRACVDIACVYVRVSPCACVCVSLSMLHALPLLCRSAAAGNLPCSRIPRRSQ